MSCCALLPLTDWAVGHRSVCRPGDDRMDTASYRLYFSQSLPVSGSAVAGVGQPAFLPLPAWLARMNSVCSKSTPTGLALLLLTDAHTILSTC